MNSTLTITVNFPEDFIERIKAVIEEEIAEASKKWKAKLSDEEKDVVRKASLAQLRSKVSTLSKNNWDLGSKMMINAAGDSGALTFSEGSKVKTNLSFIQNKTGWSVTNEEADSVIPAEDFYETLVNTLFTWTRTAVFYGVGSYTSK